MQHKPNNQQRLPTLEVKRIFGKFWTRKGLDRLSIFSQGVPYLTEEVEARSWHSMYLLPGSSLVKEAQRKTVTYEELKVKY